MDDIELLVNETYKHFNLSQAELLDKNSVKNETGLHPSLPGIIYHVQKSTSVFVIRTFLSKNIREDFVKILEAPEDYPSLRLIDLELNHCDQLKFFPIENFSQAEIIHDQLHNRRFPMNEEMMCNLSDPGFSWWLTKKEKGFQIAFTMSVASSPSTMKIGPLGDKELALRNFQVMEELIHSAGLQMSIENESNRVQFTDCEEFLLEELKDVFEFGVITETLRDIFKILKKKTQNLSALETSWFYLQEIGAMRRFWIQIQFDVNASQS